MALTDFTKEQWAFIASRAAENNDVLYVGTRGASDPAAGVAAFNNLPEVSKPSVLASIESITHQQGWPVSMPAGPAAPPPEKKSNMLLWVGAGVAFWYFFMRKKSGAVEAYVEK